MKVELCLIIKRLLLRLVIHQLEQQRQMLHVPGMAIAVVKDDEVILTHGFGVANINVLFIALFSENRLI